MGIFWGLWGMWDGGDVEMDGGGDDMETYVRYTHAGSGRRGARVGVTAGLAGLEGAYFVRGEGMGKGVWVGSFSAVG